MIKIISILTIALAGAGCAAPGAVDPVGAWGGDHVVLTVGPAASTLEFDCAYGRIPGPFAVDAGGRFDLSGVFVREQGGPVREGEVLPEQPARYSGEVAGPRMTLTVSLAGEGAGEIGTFALEKGREPLLTKCL